ncbi:MAG: OmpA family protein [Alsobacter sp.]
MIRPNRWWPGLIPVGLVWLAVIVTRTGHVERDVAARSAQALAGITLDAPATATAGRDVTLSGRTFEPEARGAARSAVDAVSGVRLVSDQLASVPTAKPYLWSATRDGAKLTLEGSVPSPQARATLAGAASAIPGAEVQDATVYAVGAPPGFAGAAGFAIAQLKNLRKGKAQLADGTLSLSGEAPSSEAFAAVASAFDALPTGLKSGTVAVLPPVAKPYDLAIERRGQAFTVTGHLPTPQAKASLFALLRKAAPDATVADRTTYARGSADAFGPAVQLAAGILTQLAQGSATLSDARLQIVGEAPTSQAYVAAMGALETPPAGLTVAAEIAPPLARPFLWQAARTADGVVISGSVPSATARKALGEALATALPGIKLRDDTTFARGAPAAFSAATAAGLKALADLSSGSVALSGSRLAIQGQAASSEGFARLAEKPLSLPAGVAVASLDVRPPTVTPYGFSADRDGPTLTLAGAVPSPKLKSSVLARVAQLFPGATLVDKLAYGSGAPMGYDAALAKALAGLAHLTKGTATVADGVITLQGQAATASDYEQALASLPDPPGGMTARDAGLVAPLATPWRWSAERAADRLILEGSVPSPQARAALIAAASGAAPGLPVEDRLAYASGAPAGFETSAPTLVRHAVRLQQGRIVVNDASVQAEGRAATEADKAAIEAALAALPKGFAVQSTLTAPPPAFRFQAEKNPDAGRLVLSGSVPDDATRQAIVETAKRRFFADAVVDDLKPGPGAPPDFGALASLALSQLARMGAGTLAITPQGLQLQGEALYARAADEIRAALASLPGGLTATLAVGVRAATGRYDPKACQEQLAGTLARGTILFETSQATLDPASTPVLDALAFTVLQCPGQRIRIEGHTDSTGTAEGNADLSRRRAAAVRDYLAGAGIAPDGLTAEGFGASRPVASNETDEGRAKNRRIEFIVVDGP